MQESCNVHTSINLSLYKLFPFLVLRFGLLFLLGFSLVGTRLFKTDTVKPLDYLYGTETRWNCKKYCFGHDFHHSINLILYKGTILRPILLIEHNIIRYTKQCIFVIEYLRKLLTIFPCLEASAKSAVAIYQKSEKMDMFIKGI